MRPTTLTVFCLLNIGFGAVYLILSCFTAVGALQEYQAVKAEFTQETGEHEYKEGETVQFEVPEYSDDDYYDDYYGSGASDRKLPIDALLSLVGPLLAVLC